MNWRYVDAAHTVAFREFNGGSESCLASALPADTEVLPYTPPPPPVPQVVSAAQFRCGLTKTGLRQMVDSAVKVVDQDTKDWYEFATIFERQHPRVLGMAMALGVGPDELDTLWTVSATF